MFLDSVQKMLFFVILNHPSHGNLFI